jgi:tetratricopeptide (TPR) repeat protein
MKNHVTYTLSIILSLLSTVLFSQDLPITDEAVQHCVDRNYAQALVTIDRAILNAKEKSYPRTWYVKSYIHKELYKTKFTSEDKEKELSEAARAIEKSIELDPEKLEWNQSFFMLEYLYVQYHQLARGYAITQNEVENTHVDELFEEFIRLRKMGEPEVDLTEYKLTYYKAMGQKNYDRWESEPILHSEALQEGENYFKKALALDSTDCDANYNVVVGYYNLGVQKIKQLNTSSDITELIMTQEESIRLFRKSLPYINKAYTSCPEELQIVRAMFYVYRSLDREEEAFLYAKEIERLLSKGN